MSENPKEKLQTSETKREFTVELLQDDDLNARRKIVRIADFGVPLQNGEIALSIRNFLLSYYHDDAGNPSSWIIASFDLEIFWQQPNSRQHELWVRLVDSDGQNLTTMMDRFLVECGASREVSMRMGVNPQYYDFAEDAIIGFRFPSGFWEKCN